MHKHSKKESAEELHKKMTDFKSHLTANAMECVNVRMPAKILHLHELFKSSPFNLDLSKISTPMPLHNGKRGPDADDTRAKKRKTGDQEPGTAEDHLPDIPCNKVVLDLLNTIKKETIELVEILNAVKIWIQLNIPRIEDGNNFGVGIQEETVNELSRAEESSFAILEGITKYFVNRAKLISKVFKHPHIEDYQRSIIELDEKEYLNIRLCCLDMRNNYAIVYDIIQKNLEKLKTPRTSHHMAVMF